MVRKWGVRVLIGLGALVGAFLVVAFALQVPAVGKAIGNGTTCGTCHVMTSEVVSLSHSAHRDRSCLECHSKRGFLEKPLDEIKTASRHVYVFLSNSTPDVIKPGLEARETIQENCIACHAPIMNTVHVAEKDSGKMCFDCHRDTPHGRVHQNN